MRCVVNVANVEEKGWKSIFGISFANPATNIEDVAELSEQRDELKEGSRRPAARMTSETVDKMNVCLSGKATVDIEAGRSERVDM